MNILIGQKGFEKENIKSVYSSDQFNDNDQIYTIFDDLTKEELRSIDIQVGFDNEITNQLINDPDSNLKWIHALSAGVDYLPLAKIKAKHILLSNVSGIHAEPIAESTIGMILSLYRDLNTAAAKNQWYQPNFSLPVLREKKIYVFGTGSIGQRIGELGQSFNADTVGINSTGHPVNGFDQAIPTEEVQNTDKIDADIIVNALPLTDKTKNFFNQVFFNKLTNHPMFVTIGRGPSTNTNDLIDALNNQTLGSAALDVTDPEPLPKDNPLWKMANVLITPHTSGSNYGYIEKTFDIFKENLKENLDQFKTNGKLKRNQVDLNTGY